MFEKEAEELIEESKRLNTTPRETVCKAIEFGFQKGIKAKINTTTISDCPIKDAGRITYNEIEELYGKRCHTCDNGSKWKRQTKKKEGTEND